VLEIKVCGENELVEVFQMTAVQKLISFHVLDLRDVNIHSSPPTSWSYTSLRISVSILGGSATGSVSLPS